MRYQRWLFSLFSLALSASCAYDLSGIYESASVPDAGVGPREAGAPLLALWAGYPGVDDECARCARERCAESERVCEADPGCDAYTRCVAGEPTPAGQARCRERHAEWVRAGDVRARDLNGPYGQCVFRYECAGECEGNADLSCVSGYRWPTTSSLSVRLHLFLQDAVNEVQDQGQLRGTQVKVCLAADLLCVSPFSEGTADAQGLVELELPTSFDRAFTGYLEVQGAHVYPTLIKLGWSLAVESTQIVSVVNRQTFELFALGASPDPGRGMVQTRMLGCQGIGVRGVRFSAEPADPAQRSWYIVDGVPRFDASETNLLGSGGIVDLPPGRALVQAVRSADGAVVAATEAPVRASFMTVVVFAPLPQP